MSMTTGAVQSATGFTAYAYQPNTPTPPKPPTTTPPTTTPPPSYPPIHPPTHPPTDECEDKIPVYVSRELDGKNNGGAVGAAIDNVAETNKFFLLPQNRARGVHDINAGGPQTDAVLLGQTKNAVLCANDMFVAGDPFVGGSTNGYKPTDIDPAPGWYSMFKDGSSSARNVSINGRVETINKEGQKAFTQYGFVFRDDSGQTTKAVLAGGRMLIGTPDGQHKVLLPPNGQHVVGDPKDPTAKIYYGTRPGDGEPRLLVDYYEKPTEASIQKMMAAGIDEATARAKRTVTTSSYAWRIPDQFGPANRAPQGYPTGEFWPNTADGNKTYYDTHWQERDCTLEEICVDKPEPPKPLVAPGEYGRVWGDPHIKGGDTTADWSYTIDEQGLFNILEDSNVAVRAEFAQGPSGNTISNRTAFSIGTNQMIVGRGGQMAINGQILPNQANLTLQDGTKVLKDNQNIQIRTNNQTEYDFDIVAGNEDVDLRVKTKAIGVENGFLPFGLLGETFDTDMVSETAPKRPVADYRVSNFFATPSAPPLKTSGGTGGTTGTGSTGNTGSTGSTGSTGNTGSTGSTGNNTQTPPANDLTSVLTTLVNQGDVQGVMQLILQLLQMAQ